jgi:hypothetical protein
MRPPAFGNASSWVNASSWLEETQNSELLSLQRNEMLLSRQIPMQEVWQELEKLSKEKSV